MNLFQVFTGIGLAGAGYLTAKTGSSHLLNASKLYRGVEGLSKRQSKKFLSSTFDIFSGTDKLYIKQPGTLKALAGLYYTDIKKARGLGTLRRVGRWFTAAEFSPGTWNRMSKISELTGGQQVLASRVGRSLGRVSSGLLTKLRLRTSLTRVGATMLTVAGTGLALKGVVGGRRRMGHTMPYTWG